MKNNILGRILSTACIIFTAIVLIIYFVISLMGMTSNTGLISSMVFSLFTLSLVISCVSVFYAVSKMPTIAKYFIHLVVTVASTAIQFGFINENLKGQTIFVAEIIIIILHVVIFMTISAIKKAMRPKEKYESVYKKLKKED